MHVETVKYFELGVPDDYPNNLSLRFEGPDCGVDADGRRTYPPGQTLEFTLLPSKNAQSELSRLDLVSTGQGFLVSKRLAAILLGMDPEGCRVYPARISFSHPDIIQTGFKQEFSLLVPQRITDAVVPSRSKMRKIIPALANSPLTAVAPVFQLEKLTTGHIHAFPNFRGTVVSEKIAQLSSENHMKGMAFKPVEVISIAQ